MAAIATVGASATLTACGGDDGGSTATFCQAVQANSEQLFGGLPAPLTPAATIEFIELARSVGASAPLEIEADWNAWVLTLENTYTNVDEQEILATAYASQKSALAIDEWLRANCGAGVGVPIGTVPPLAVAQPPAEATATVTTA